VRAEDRASFEDWYRAEHARLVAAMVLVSGDVDVARDAVDEAFTRALANWRRVATMESPTGWTYRVALNALRRSARRASRERQLLVHQFVENDHWTNVPRNATDAWDAVRDLPMRQRTAVVLRYVADLTEADIARAMGISRSTVSSTLIDARARLGRLLAEDAD
jgi:RNA polymerase sigma-70 factor (ECF subfamily)